MEGTDGRVQVRVSDQGIGIAAADRSRIFQQFERAVSSTHYGGLGLGLFITQQIVEALGGRIWVEGEEGRGSAWSLDLPREGPTRSEATGVPFPGTGPAPSGESRGILA